MKIQFALLFGLLLTFSACTKEECTDAPLNQKAHELDGEWHLRSIFTLSPFPVELEQGENVWTIDVEENLLSIENMSSNESTFIPESGEFTITVTADSMLFVTDGFGYELEDGTLRVHNRREVDGPTMLFER